MRQPEPGERVTLRWPGGPHDFVIEFVRLAPASPPEGWVLVTGFVVEPEGVKHRTTRTFHARPAGDAEFELLPR